MSGHSGAPIAAHSASSTPRLLRTYRSHSLIGDFGRNESVGGVVLLVATIAAIILANSGIAHTYFDTRDHHLGFAWGPLHLDLSIGHWAADGLLAVFFFVIGLELKKEFLTVDLSSVGKAIVPVTAAVGGVALPALLFVGITAALGDDAEALNGWAIPTATDIAFALAVLAVVGKKLPAALRMFLLALAVVDDLIAITIIALFYTSDLNIAFLALALIPMALYAFFAYRLEGMFFRKAWTAWAILLPLGLLTWALFHESGIHATIAGVLLGFCIPVRKSRRSPADAESGLAEVLEHRIRPLAALVCVPMFAFFSAGVALGGWEGFFKAVAHPVGIGIVLGLVLGKCIGITGATWLVTRIRGISLDREIAWGDLFGLSLIAGIGFTVSLLIAELSFTPGGGLDDIAKVGILTGSVLAALVGGAVLAMRGQRRAARER